MELLQSPKPIYISGIVAMCADARRRVAAGLAPDAREELRAEVADCLRRVEELCAEHGGSPEDLPAPSRSAYRYLKTLDWGGVPLPSAENGPVEPSLRIKGLLRAYLRIQHDLQHAGSEGARRRALERARRVAERVEEICGEDGPETLSSKEREAYRHLKGLAGGESDPGADVRLFLEAYRGLGLEEPPSMLVLYYPYAGLKSGIRRRGGAVEVRLSDGWRKAPEEVQKGLAFGLVCRLEGLECPEVHRRAVDGFLDAGGRSIHRELRRERGRKLLLGASGEARDLGESFERVNHRYFGGEVRRPELSWSADRTRNLFGHQDPAMNAVVISRTLDDAAVPEFVLDYVMFHEMLHVEHGVQHDGGRRVVHPPAFRDDLRRFERRQEAEEWVRRLAEEGARTAPEPRPAPPAPGPKVGRNDPCPCGSGRKFKMCCMADARKGHGPRPGKSAA